MKYNYKDKNNPMYGRKHSKETRRKISKKVSGKNAPSYIDNRTNKKYYCIVCHKQISNTSGIYGKGRCKSCANTGKNNAMFNKYHTKITKKKISQALKGKNNYLFGKSRSKKIKKQISLSKGGTGIPYEYNNYPEEYFKIRPIILKRDKFECQNCNMTEEEHLTVIGRTLEVHHIDYNKKNCKEENLITLCKWCNLRANYNRNYWKTYYQNKLLQTSKKD